MNEDDALELLQDLSLREWTGRLGVDPELKTLPSGRLVVNLKVALEPLCKVKNRDPNNPRQNTQWLHCSNWTRPQEIFDMGLTKNDHVTVRGQIVLRNYCRDGTRVLEHDAIVVSVKRA